MSSRYGGRPSALVVAVLLAASCSSAATEANGSAPPGERVGAASAGSERVAAGDATTAVPADRSESAPAAAAALEPLPSEPVYLNGERLSDPDLRELQAVLGHAPVPGRYWYDPRSGLWGLEEHGAGGVTRPGLRIPAPVPAQASRGDSGAFVNDRQLTARELSIMAALLGWAGQSPASLSGRYLLDEQGGLYSAQGRYLGSLANAAAEARARGTSPAPCAWLQLGASPDVLGRTVTINCD